MVVKITWRPRASLLFYHLRSLSPNRDFNLGTCNKRFILRLVINCWTWSSQNVFIFHWRADQLFAKAESWYCNWLTCSPLSRCFAITEVNNCFIIPSPSLSSYLNHFKSHKRYPREKYHLQQNVFKTHLDQYYAWPDRYLKAVICGSSGGLSANVMIEKMNRMIRIVCTAGF